jgi:hypothetical protein
MDTDNFHRPRSCSSNTSGSVVLGGLIVAVGVLFLLQSLGVPLTHNLWSYWPMALIALGVVKVIECARPSSVVAGGLFAAAGGLLLLRNLDVFTFDWHVAWPLIIVGVGVIKLTEALEFESQRVQRR